MAIDLGTDVSCFPDLDPLGTLVSGKTALAQAIARRLTTPRGGLFYDTNYGTDLRLYLNEGMTSEAQSRIKAAIESECRKDERVASATADVTFNAAAQSLAVSISLSIASGPFTLTLAVTQLTVALLTVT
jgi:phage baseplate assembly protein W